MISYKKILGVILLSKLFKILLILLIVISIVNITLCVIHITEKGEIISLILIIILHIVFIALSGIALRKNWNNKKVITILIYGILMLAITFFIPTQIDIEHKYYDYNDDLLPSGNLEYRKSYNIYWFLLDSSNGPQAYY